jgi:hypothetical protein
MLHSALTDKLLKNAWMCPKIYEPKRVAAEIEVISF